MKMYRKPCKQLYHIFTNGHDEWTSDLKEARQIAYEMIKETGRKWADVRIYMETNWASFGCSKNAKYAAIKGHLVQSSNGEGKPWCRRYRK